MSLQATRWLIELGPAFPPEAKYLHVREDETSDWSSDKTRALRFRSRHAAETYGFAQLDCDFIASEHPAADLVGQADTGADVEDDVCPDCGLMGCDSATCEMARRRAEARARALS